MWMHMLQIWEIYSQFIMAVFMKAVMNYWTVWTKNIAAGQ